MRFIPLLCLIIPIIGHTNARIFTNPYRYVQKETVVEGNPGNPLFLTPLIEQGKIKDALTASRVFFSGFKNVTSYSGYFTVNKAHNSNMFFWYFPAQTNEATAPVILWLQGGPGASSMIGLFQENGPFKIKSKHGLKLREFSWTKGHHVIYIDNPVGTGYSFTGDDGGYAQNETAVGEDLYSALQQFFLLFPDLQKNEFYVTGESYAGKYVPAISYTIYKKNPEAKLKINLQGLSIGNGLCDPEHQLQYSDYLYQIGLIDLNARNEILKYEQEGIKHIQNKEWEKAFEIFDLLVNGDLNNHQTLFKNITGFDYYYNFLQSNNTGLADDLFVKYVQRDDIRNAIHVGNSTFNAVNVKVEKHLILDVVQSVAPLISELLSNYRVLIYNGQLDIIVAYPLTENFLQNLSFDASDEYKKATRSQWWVDGELAGYMKTAGNLTEVLVRNAGHMVPTDQPKWAFDLITRFTHHKAFV